MRWIRRRFEGHSVALFAARKVLAPKTETRISVRITLAVLLRRTVSRWQNNLGDGAHHAGMDVDFELRGMANPADRFARYLSPPLEDAGYCGNLSWIDVKATCTREVPHEAGFPGAGVLDVTPS